MWLMYENMGNLLELYNNSLEEFKQDGYHPHPANLLAMLLLPQKDRFEPLRVSEGVFYETYKAEIDSKISKVIYDFQISDQEIEAFMEEEGVLANNFDWGKIWLVFAAGFGVMHGEMMYRPNQTDSQIYDCMPNNFTLYKMTEHGLDKYFMKKRILVRSKILKN